MMIVFLVSLFFLFLYALLFAYYGRGWRSTPDFTAEANPPHRFLSVVIPARNEEKNLSRLLLALEQQSYPVEYFEVIVVDDFSTDGTAAIVRKQQMANLQLIQPDTEPSFSSKKKAIEAGVRQAKGELILTTDADCLPSPEWLSVMNAFFVHRKACFIAAPVKFSHAESLLEIFQTLDFISLQGITAASVSAGFHTMCNGANLAYTKKAFMEVRGFEGIDRVATGDDLLLMYKIWKKFPDKVFYLKNKKAVMLTRPMPTLREFFMQRKRWASKSLVYDDYRIIAVLAFVYLLNLWFFFLIGASFIQSIYWWFVLVFWIAKTVIEFPLVLQVSRFYEEEKLMPWFFFFQPLHMLYTVLIGLLSQWGRYEWKGRKTK